MSTLKDEIGLLREDVQELKRAIVGDPKDPDFKGLNERIRRLEGHWLNVGRVVWLAVGSAIAGLVTMAFGLLR